MASRGPRNDKVTDDSDDDDNKVFSAPPRNKGSRRANPLSDPGIDTPSGKEFWDRMDKHNDEVLGNFKKTFRINSSINIILVIIGTVLIANAIVYSWIHGTADGWSIFSGGIGLGALVSLFFYKSQDAISKAAANLAIVDMAFNSNYRAYESVTDYDFKADHNLPHRSLEDLKQMLELLEKTTRAHVDMIAAIQLIEAATEDENDEDATG